MTIKQKSTKIIDHIIDQGGMAKADNEESEVVRFTLSLPKQLTGVIDQKRADRYDKPTRHRWIIEAIMAKLDRDGV